MTKTELRIFLNERNVIGFVMPSCVAAALNVHIKTVWGWMTSGELKKRGRGCYHADDVLEFLWRNPEVVARYKRKEQKRHAMQS